MEGMEKVKNPHEKWLQKTMSVLPLLNACRITCRKGEVKKNTISTNAGVMQVRGCVVKEKKVKNGARFWWVSMQGQPCRQRRPRQRDQQRS